MCVHSGLELIELHGVLPARRIRKRDTCHGNVSGWLGGGLDECLPNAGIVSKRLNLS